MNKILFRRTEELFRRQVAEAGGSALQEADVQHRHILAGSIDAPERGGEVVKGVVVAHQNQNVILPDSHRLGSELFSRDEMELVKLLVNALARAGDFFGNRENGEEHNRKGNPGDGRDLLGE